MADAPAFDPSQPFEPAAAPAFDPSKPFEPAHPTQAQPKTFVDKLGETWPGKMAKSLYNFATLPGDVVTGKVRLPSSEGIVPGSITPDESGATEATGRVAEAAMWATPVSPSVRNWNFLAPKSAPVAPEVQQHMQEAERIGFPLSHGQASGNLDDIRYLDLASRGAYGPEAQKRAVEFFEQQYSGIQGAGRNIGETVARDTPVAESPGIAAGTVNAELSESARAARAAQEAATARAAQEAAASRGIVGDQGRVLNEALREGHLPIENPREAGEIVGHEVRGAAAQSRQNYQGLYREAFELPGEFHAATFEGVGNRIQGRMTLGENPVIIDDVTTPVASRAIRDLDNISNLRIQNRADPFGAPNPESIVGVDLRGVDQARKRLVAFYRNARSSNNAADVRATERLIDEFDNQIEGAISNGLFTGDERALGALQHARAAYSNYARTFRPRQAGDDVGTAMRRIVDRNATPEEIGNMIIGSGRLGNAGLPVRIADRLEGILGRDSDAWSSIRQGIWQRASQVRNLAGEIDPVRSASSISDFVDTSLARRMFSPQERAAMRSHAQGVRDLDQTIAQLPTTQAAERVQNTYQQAFGGEGIGGAQATVFRRIMEGTATPEETAQAVFGAIGSGNPGNVSRMLRSIEHIAGPNSDVMGAIRQGAWQRLTQNAVGKDQPGQQKMVQAINEFLNGKGRTIAEQLYSPSELALMRQYSDAVRRTIIPKYARTNSDTTPAMLATIRKIGSGIAAAIGLGTHGPLGGLAGYGVSKILDKGAAAVGEARAAQKVSDAINGTVPRQRINISPRQIAPIGRGMMLQRMPQLGSGPVPSAAQEQQPQ